MIAARVLVAAVILVASRPASAYEVSVPVRLDTAFVRQALVAQLYTEPGEHAAVWKDGTGCGALDLFEPSVDVVGGRLRITSRGEARVGAPVAGHCLFSLQWRGFVEVFEEPGLDGRTLTFRVVDSNVYDAFHRKRFTTGVLWDLVKGQVHPRLALLRIDVGRPLEELRAWLPLVLPGSEEHMETLLASLDVRDPHVTEDGVAVTMAFTIEPRAPAQPPEPALTEEELARWRASWQRWDAFLTFVVKQVARDVGTEELRRAVLDVLLDSRHDLLEALSPSGPGAPDPVPGLFVKAWERLAPVLRQAAPGLPAETALQYLSFITAADALAALGRLGPDVGLDVSADGLRRLARMIAPASTEDPVAYSEEVDPELRTLLGLGPPLPPPDVAPDVQLDLESWLVGTAWADVDGEAIARLNRWAPSSDDLDTYLPLVRDLLDHLRRQALEGSDLTPEFQGVYLALVPATAWEESCWRQFVRQNGRLVPLRSPVGSIGIMQVNQHVWRGAYDVRGLHGDIAYNGRAGSEILLHYLRDYAIARGEERQPGGIDNLARATYALYNGGPGHMTRYRGRHRSQALKRIDDGFWEKYVATRAGREMEVARCYGG